MLTTYRDWQAWQFNPRIPHKAVSDWKWHDRFLRLAEEVSTWSKDPNTKVGAVITKETNRVLSLGYNGFPTQINDDPAKLADRAVKNQWTVHAELNAILNGQPERHPPWPGYTLYATLPPCSRCALAAVQADISTVWTIAPDAERLARWGGDMRLGAEIFRAASCEYWIVNPEHLGYYIEDTDRPVLSTTPAAHGNGGTTS